MACAIREIKREIKQMAIDLSGVHTACMAAAHNTLMHLHRPVPIVFIVDPDGAQQARMADN